MNCTHAPRAITWPGGSAYLSPGESWLTVKTGPEGLGVHKLEKCPGCGVDLWGMPGAKPEPSGVGVLHV